MRAGWTREIAGGQKGEGKNLINATDFCWKLLPCRISNLSDAMNTELRVEDLMIPSTSLCISTPLTSTTLLAGWPTECHSCQTTSVFSSAPGLSADDTHITINLHHKATFVLDSVTTHYSQVTILLYWQRQNIYACSAFMNMKNDIPPTVADNRMQITNFPACCCAT